MNGMVAGGWEFVWAAYAITATALLVYGGSLLLRYRRDLTKQEQEGDR
jgi:heme exporter protein D